MNTPPPRVLLVMRAQWSRALLRATLRELGYDATGTQALKPALHHAAPQEGRGPVRLIVLDQDALTDADEHYLEELRRGTAPIVLLASVTRRVPDGPWTRVVRRPVSIGELVQAVEKVLPLPPKARQPID